MRRELNKDVDGCKWQNDNLIKEINNDGALGVSYRTWNLFVDFAILSTFLLTGQALRAKLSILQKYMKPASLVGGCLARFRSK
jgi:hypothetical protein